MNPVIAVTAIIAAMILGNVIVYAIRDVAKAKHGYPHRTAGDFIALGPDVFTDPDGNLITWKGAAYVRQDTKEHSA